MIEWPEIDQFVCNNLECIMHPMLMTEIDEAVLFSRFDKTYRCAECGNEVEMVEPRKAEWVSVALYVITSDPSHTRYSRIDSTVRAYEGGDWPQASLYAAQWEGDVYERPMVFGEKLPPEQIEKDYTDHDG